MRTNAFTDVLDEYQDAFELLDAYDREAIPRPAGTPGT